MKSFPTCCLCAAVLFAVSGARVFAEDAGITVSGTGEVKAKPDQVEIEINTSGSAELTGDAIVKYRDSTRRTLAAFKGLKLKNLKIEEKGLSIASSSGSNPLMAMVNPGAGAAAAKSQTVISRAHRVVLSNIRDMPEEQLMEVLGRILDTAKDSGASTSPSSQSQMLSMMFGGRGKMSQSLVTFVLNHAAELREQAYQKAFEQARSRAQRLAALAGAELGPVLSVQEGPPAPKNTESIQERMVSAMYGIGSQSADDDDGMRVTSDKFGQIAVRVTLQVRFAIKNKAGS